MRKIISKRLLTMFIVIAMLLAAAPLQAAAHGNGNSHWAHDRAQDFISRGVIDDEDGLDDYLTRLEFVEIINNYFDFEATAAVSFSDVPSGTQMMLQVQIAVSAGYIKGYPDGTFKPDKNISRQEAAVIIAKLMKFELFGGSEALDFSDSFDVPEWSWGAINSCIRHGILRGYPNRQLGAKKYLTKAEVLSMLTYLDTYIGETVTVPVITSLTLANGTVKVNFNKEISGLNAADFTLTARLDGAAYTLSGLIFDTSTETFWFTPIAKTNAVQTLKVTIAADSSEISGTANSTIEIASLSTAEAAPVASLLSIGGNPRVGNTLIGHYTYTDINSDAEGPSLFSWYRADNASGTGKTHINGAAGSSYTLTAADSGKYISFEVTPIALSGDLIGLTKESSPIYIYKNGTDILTFTLAAQTSAAVIDTVNHTVNVPVADGTSLVSLSPSITVSPGAAISPASGVSRNFTSAVGYSVTAQDGSVQIWTVTVGTAAQLPAAANVTITGTPKTGQTLTGHYTYFDANGDLEGTSLFKWYRADNATGTNKTAITGAVSNTYTLTSQDAGKYISFEVTPVSQTGAPGTRTGLPIESNPLYILKTGKDILTFTLAEQTAAAAIDSVNHTVSIQVANGASLVALTPTITISSGAAISPFSGVTQNFTLPVQYNVIAEDGTSQIWTVTVTAA